ncbi:MAG: tail fiber protein [bacterium]|nr:MAG: tail fiber protein [bacterium]
MHLINKVIIEIGRDKMEESAIDKLNKRVTELEKKIKKIEKIEMPIGTILPYGGDIRRIPEGWLHCNGKSVEKSKYVKLYKIINDNFGSDKDTNKFKLPDIRGRFVRGVDHEAGNDPDVDSRTDEDGNEKGNEVGSIQNDEFKKHVHRVRGTGPPTNSTTGSADSFVSAGVDSSEVGGEETRPKNIYVEWIIYSGV